MVFESVSVIVDPVPPPGVFEIPATTALAQVYTGVGVVLEDVIV